MILKQVSPFIFLFFFIFSEFKPPQQKKRASFEKKESKRRNSKQRSWNPNSSGGFPTKKENNIPRGKVGWMAGRNP